MRNLKLLAPSDAIALILIASLLSCSGCSMFRKTPPPVAAVTVDDQTPKPDAPASVEIDYAKADDTLRSVVVSQFTGANVLRTLNQGDNQASVVRFDGGVPIWKFHASRSLLNPLSEIQRTPFRVASVDYGKVPPNFTQDSPDAGPPPPLIPGGYYIFAIERASGATSYEAVRVKSDFSLQAYDAEPRAGTSYLLCCGVSSDFAEPTPSDDEEPASLSTPPGSSEP